MQTMTIDQKKQQYLNVLPKYKTYDVSRILLEAGFYTKQDLYALIKDMDRTENALSKAVNHNEKTTDRSMLVGWLLGTSKAGKNGEEN